MSYSTVCRHESVYGKVEGSPSSLWHEPEENIDIGRLPSNMKEKNSLSGLTAEQMKNFAIVYARACLKGLIPDTSYKVLCLLCNIVTIIYQPVLTEDNLTCLYRLLHDHHSAYCRLYGKF